MVSPSQAGYLHVGAFAQCEAFAAQAGWVAILCRICYIRADWIVYDLCQRPEPADRAGVGQFLPQ